MNKSNQALQGCGFRSEHAPEALEVVRKQLEIINWGNPVEFGIFDRSSQHFLLYQWRERQIPAPGFIENPTLSYFTQQLRSSDLRLVEQDLRDVHAFLESKRPAQYIHYRLTFDGCLCKAGKEKHRVMVHIRYLKPTSEFPEGLCLFQLYSIRHQKSCTPLLRAFCSFPGLEPELFKKGERSMPDCTAHRRAIFIGLRQGLGLKQIADQLDCTTGNIDKTLGKCRRALFLCNNPQLVDYARNFGWI